MLAATQRLFLATLFQVGMHVADNSAPPVPGRAKVRPRRSDQSSRPSPAATAIAQGSKATGAPTLPESVCSAHSAMNSNSLIQRPPSAAVKHISSDAEMPLTIMNEEPSGLDSTCAAAPQNMQNTLNAPTVFMSINPKLDLMGNFNLLRIF
jgi:hypothetical protein